MCLVRSRLRPWLMDTEGVQLSWVRMCSVSELPELELECDLLDSVLYSRR